MKKFFKGRRFLWVISVMVVITIIATFVLSSLISLEVKDVSEDIARRSFQKKFYDLEHEFKVLQKPLDDARRLMDTPSTFEDEYHNFTMLNSLQFLDTTIYRNWLFLKTDEGISNAQFNSRQKQKENVKQFLGARLADDNISKIESYGEGYVWRNQITIPTDSGIVYFGYDIPLGVLQQFFYNVDYYSLSYAYIFDQNGTCLLHPEAEKIGRNVFSFAPLEAEDTIFQNTDFHEKIADSEYLKLDVISFLRPMQMGQERWYVSVNFPKSLNEEDVNLIKRYAFVTYLISTLLLLFVFYAFTYRINKEHKEKEQLEKEKADLALEKEVFKRESAFFQLQQLKNQINPHLLFNSLNTLYTLIDHDQSLSQKFTYKLSNLYRYLTDRPENNLATVEEELKIVEEFLFLQNIRFGKKLKTGIVTQDTEALTLELPYLALQTVVENALKHNIATHEAPLMIKIRVTSNYLEISNTYQPKRNAEAGSKFGLKYLDSIYEFYRKEGFETRIEEKSFVCKLPLLP
ncbi:histidine kinase [Fulvivirga maritima]|uniref:histidine kinase n=1 Tax=Fulvivirga maritima TaxID=2904247 RepID=UPI001F1F6FE1|nr:histidine kinase [Fulvivirga maritima]UII28195.1 histidine kinase [Fulvivirga maritima]